MSDKLRGRFVTTSKPSNYINCMRRNDITIYQVEYDEETTKKILSQAEKYFLSKFSSYYYENDVNGEKKKGECYGGFELNNLISAFSNSYYTDEPQADILVSGREFAGVVVLMQESGGSSWESYNNEWFVIHYLDGSIEGKNRSESATYTEDNSSEDSVSYYLIKK